MPNQTWPTDYPKDCPPGSAQPANGLVYRVSKTNPLTDEFFQGQIHTQPGLTRKRIEAGQTDSCFAHGLSVNFDIEDAIQNTQNHPQIGRFIFAIDLTADDGSMFTGHGQGSHATWWRSTGSSVTPVIVDPPGFGQAKC